MSPSTSSGPRQLIVAAIAAAVISTVIALAYGYAGHSPKPRDVDIAVAGPPAVQKGVAAGLSKAGGFRVKSTDAAGAVRAVRRRDADGALVVGSGSPQIVTAAAAGLSQQQAIEGALSKAVASAGGPAARDVDVAPLPAGDSGGQSSFIFLLALLIPSVMGTMGLYLVGARRRLWWRVGAGALYAVLASLVTLLILDTLFGALTGAPLELFAFGALGAFTCVLFVIACQAALGLSGTGIAAFVFLFVGNGMSGGTVPRSFLPDGFREISGWLPNSAIVDLVRNSVYFDRHDIGHALLVLALWAGVSLAVLAAIDLLQRSARAHASESDEEIYAASASQVLAHRRAGRQAGVAP